MSKNKHRKDHKKKLEARKQRLLQDKNRKEKFQREMIMNLIDKEKQKGLFDNLPSINPISGPQIDLNGPTI
jgi:uncharacterized protein YjgD (DUF1641 family)